MARCTGHIVGITVHLTLDHRTLPGQERDCVPGAGGGKQVSAF